MNLNEEKKLLIEIKDNKKAYEDLYKEFVDDVYRFTYSLVLNKHDAEDVTSQVFIEFYKKIDTYEWKGISMKVWLFRSARFLAYKRYRKPDMDNYDENIPVGTEYEISFVDEIINKDMLNKAQEELEKLDPLQRESIILRIWEGMQFDEIASIQECKVDAVKKRFYRGIEKLRTNLKEKGHTRMFALPVLFTSLKDLGVKSEVYKPSSIFMESQKDILNGNNVVSKGLLSTGLGKGIVAGAIVTTVGIVSFGGYLLYSNLSDDNESEQEKTSEVIEEVTPTPTPTILPTIDEGNVVGLETTSTPTPVVRGELGRDQVNTQNGLSTYQYDFLGVEFDYPSDWEIEEISNVKPVEDVYLCEPFNVSDVLHDESLCEQGTIDVKELEIRGPEGEKIHLWVDWGTGRGACPDCTREDTNISILGEPFSYSLYPGREEGTMSNHSMSVISLNSRSPWKVQFLNFKTPNKSYDQVLDVLDSMRYIE